MSMMRWEPFREMTSLRDAMDRLLGESYIMPRFFEGTSGMGFPLDVSEHGDMYEIRASLPGVRPEDVDITVSGDTLTIKGERKEEHEEKERNYLMREHRFGSFMRTITLPTEMDAEHARASFEDGTLTLEIPKSEQAKPKRIEIHPQHTLGQGEQMTMPSEQSQYSQPGQQGQTRQTTPPEQKPYFGQQTPPSGTTSTEPPPKPGYPNQPGSTGQPH